MTTKFRQKIFQKRVLITSYIVMCAIVLYNYFFLQIIEFEKFEFAIEYLFALKKWPPNHPVLTGSIFLVAEFIKFANNQEC